MIHPAQSAAVAYVSGRADPLCAAFGFVGLFLGMRMLRANGAKKWAHSFGASLALLASALSKELGLLFLALWLLIAIAPRARENFWRALGMVAAVLVIYLSLRLPAEHVAPPPPRHAMPLLVRPIVVARAVAEYAGLLVLPLHLHMDRDVVQASLARASWRELQTLLGVILLAAAAYALWRSRRQRAIFFPLLLAVVSYLPVSGLVTLNATVAEHWVYLPSAFLFLAGASALDSLGVFSRRRRVVAICLTIWLLFLGARTFLRTFDWKDQRTFLTQTIAAGGDSARMLINLGGLELSEGHLDAARSALEQALAREPDEPLALLNLAAVAIKAQDFARARQLLESITDPPEIKARAQESLAVMEYRQSGKVNLLRLRLAARLGPPNWAMEKRYVSALSDVGDAARAIIELRTCLTIAPYRAESWLMMSELLKRIGQPNEAARAQAEAEADDVHLYEHAAPRLTQR
jgi:Tfp pilus assembly protein PilF